MRQPPPFETPFLATVAGGKLRLHDKDGYDEWLASSFGDGERVMVVVMPLDADEPGYHAAAYRYYRGAVLPRVAEAMGEANLEDAHDEIAAMFLPGRLVRNKRTKRGVSARRSSTAMVSLSCSAFCEFLDRVITWATHPDGLDIEIPLADPAWKWKQQQRVSAGQR